MAEQAKVSRIDQINQPPTVGQFYYVPCLLNREQRWVPILEPLHDDKEIIRFPHQHYHYDWRFWSDQAIGDLKQTKCLAEVFSRIANVRLLSQPVTVTWRRRKCRREMPTYPTKCWNNETSKMEQISWLSKLEQYYQHQPLSGGKCPHRGIDLTNHNASIRAGSWSVQITG